MDDKRPQGRVAVVGVMGWRELTFARNRGADASGLVVVTDKRLTHADRGLHHEKGMALPRERLLALASEFNSPEAVYWDGEHGNLLYVFTDSDPAQCVVMPVYMPLAEQRTVKKTGKVDGMATLYRLARAALADRNDLIKIR